MVTVTLFHTVDVNCIYKTTANPGSVCSGFQYKHQMIELSWIELNYCYDVMTHTTYIELNSITTSPLRGVLQIYDFNIIEYRLVVDSNPIHNTYWMSWGNSWSLVPKVRRHEEEDSLYSSIRIRLCAYAVPVAEWMFSLCYIEHTYKISSYYHKSRKHSYTAQ